MNVPDIAIEHLRVDADGRTILDIERLSIASGEALTIVGPNGAGKSTLLRTCLGLRRASTGRVAVLGHDVTRLGSGGLTRLRRAIGYVPQGLAAHGQMPLTVREVVAIGRTGQAGLFKRLERLDWALVDEWIERLGVAPLRSAAYSDLSGGEQRKVLIARAMVQQPRVLVLDEPTTHLDLGWREHIVATLDELYAQTRPTLLLVCHALEVIPRCCRRLVLLRDGRMVAEGMPEDVLTAERVADLYGPGLRVLHENGRHAVVPSGAGGT